MRILTIEDSASARRLEQEIFLRLGVSVTDIRLASNAAEGKALFDSWHPDVVFLDIDLRGNLGAPTILASTKTGRAALMDGEELGRTLLKENPQLRLVVVTAHDPGHPSVKALLASGASEVIVKPVLAARVSEVLRKVPAMARTGGPPRRS